MGTSSARNTILKSRSYHLISALLVMTPVLLGILALTLNDWRLGSLSFSDPIIMLAVVLLLPNIRKITPKQFLIIAAVLLVSLGNVVIHGAIDHSYSIAGGASYVAKILLYLTFVILLFNYIRRRELENKSLSLLLNVAVVVALIGMYISVVLALGLNLPYEFLWQFTRQDASSYLFQGGADIIRSRSIMAEPQHFGLFLNIVLVIVLFAKNNGILKIKKYGLKIGVLVLAALLTFSFSTIPVTILILLLFFYKKYGVSFVVRKEFMLVVAAVMAVIAIFWQVIYATIFRRGEQISSGDDGSAMKRLYESWSYTGVDNLFLGNGVGATPTIWNNYAYMLSDFGLVGLLLILYLTYILFKRNFYFGLFFVLFSFQKGGYLSAFYWVFVLLLFIFSFYSVQSDRKTRKVNKDA